MNTLINGIKLTIRRWKLQPQYFCLSILGLTVLLSVLVLVITYLQRELNYDRHIPNRDRIFLTTLPDENGRQIVDNKMGSTMQEKTSWITASTNIDFAEISFYQDNKHVFTERTAMVSPQFFQLFDFPFLHGEKPKEVQPLDVFITESCAIKFFEKSNVVGKSLSTKDNLGYIDTYTIRGVLKDIPTNSSIHADIFHLSYLPKSDYLYGKPGLFSYSWILLNEGIHVDDLQHRLKDFYASTGIPNNMKIEFTALDKLHFSENAELQQVFRSASPKLAIILCSITLLILLIAGINYINLFTAKSIEYVKGVGIRKTMGARNRQITSQFLIESSFHFLIAIPLAYLLAWILFTPFFSFLEIQLEPTSILHLHTIIATLFMAIILSIPCGLYPAMLLTRKNTAQLLQMANKSFRINFSTRKILIVIQYSISIVLIILSICIRKQVVLLQQRPLGFNKEQLIILPNVSLREKYHVFKRNLLANPNVISLTGSRTPIGTLGYKNELDSLHRMETIVGDFDFIKTLGINIVQGQDFDSNNQHHTQYNTDYMMLEPGKELEFKRKLLERPILISSDVVAAYGIDDPVGKIFTDKHDHSHGMIIGVTEPFALGSQRNLNSMKIILGDHGFFYGGYLYVRIANQYIPKTIQHLKEVWKSHLPNHEFSYTFADERMNNLYKSEQGLAWIVVILTIISCILSISGVLSLLALVVRQRTQEIGIRKVLGATVQGIVWMILHDSIKPVVIAMLIAFPIGWWTIHTWLEDFSYKTEVSWWMFVLAGSIGLITTLISISSQAIRAAMANPVDSLRDE